MITIEAHFVCDREVMKEAYVMHRSLRRGPKLVALAALAAIGWGGWVLIREQRYVFGGILLGIGLLALLLPRLNRTLWLRAIRSTPFYGHEVRCQFSNEGVIMVADGKGIRLPWEKVLKIVEGDTGYLVYPSSGAFFYFPAGGFATDIDAERVKGLFLSEKMRRT